MTHEAHVMESTPHPA